MKVMYLGLPFVFGNPLVKESVELKALDIE